MSRLRDAWTDGGEEARDGAETAAGYVAAGLYALTKLLAMAVDGVLIFLRSTVLGFLKRVPKVGPGIADGFVTVGYKMKLHKADVICNVIYGDGVVMPRPAEWKSEKTAYETDNGETFYAKGIGFDPKRLNGKIPTVWALRDSTEVTEPLEAPIVNARKLGRFQEFTRASGESDIAVDIDANGYEYGPGVGRPREQAMADGGGVATGRHATHNGVRGERDAETYAGSVISWRDAYELFGSKVTQEEMQQQETRGKLSVLDWDRRDQMKMVIFVFLAFLAGMFGPAIATKIAGSAGGAVTGGVNLPMTILPGVLF